MSKFKLVEELKKLVEYDPDYNDEDNIPASDELQREADYDQYKDNTKSVSAVTEEWLLNNQDLLDGDYNDKIKYDVKEPKMTILHDELMGLDDDIRIPDDKTSDFKKYISDDEEFYNKLNGDDIYFNKEIIKYSELVDHFQKGIALIKADGITFEEWKEDSF